MMNIVQIMIKINQKIIFFYLDMNNLYGVAMS